MEINALNAQMLPHVITALKDINRTKPVPIAHLRLAVMESIGAFLESAYPVGQTVKFVRQRTSVTYALLVSWPIQAPVSHAQSPSVPKAPMSPQIGSVWNAEVTARNALIRLAVTSAMTPSSKKLCLKSAVSVHPAPLGNTEIQQLVTALLVD